MDKKLLCLLVLAPLAQAQAEDRAPNEAALRHVLVRLVPSGLSVTGIKIEGMRATISGRAKDNSQISDFLRNIDASPVLETADLQEMMRVNEQSEFVLSTNVQCPAPGSALDPCEASTSSASPQQSVYKCTVDGVVTFQSTPCPG